MYQLDFLQYVYTAFLRPVYLLKCRYYIILIDKELVTIC